jgi:hypothetical protein
MVSQYPETITVYTQAESVQDADGNWNTASETSAEYSCRSEASNGNGFVAAVDGTRVNYDWKIYLPLPVDDIAPGSNVTVTGDTAIFTGTVKRFKRNQFNANIWL